MGNLWTIARTAVNNRNDVEFGDWIDDSSHFSYQLQLQPPPLRLI